MSDSAWTRQRYSGGGGRYSAQKREAASSGAGSRRPRSALSWGEGPSAEEKKASRKERRRSERAQRRAQRIQAQEEWSRVRAAKREERSRAAGQKKSKKVEPQAAPLSSVKASTHSRKQLRGSVPSEEVEPHPVPVKKMKREVQVDEKRAHKALQMFSRAPATDAPPGLLRIVHSSINKITIRNALEILEDMLEIFRLGGVQEGGSTKTPAGDEKKKAKKKISNFETGNEDRSTSPITPVSRSLLVSCLMDEIDRWTCMETGNITSFTACLPFAGLLRGLQLMGGEVVSADIVERLCISLERHVSEGEENGACGGAQLISLLYLLCGVDATLLVSLLKALLRRGEEVQHSSEDNIEEEERTKKPLPESVLCAAAAALTLIRACGEKLHKEAPAELERLVRQGAMVSSSLGGRPGSARYAALVQVLREIVLSGAHGKASKRSQVENEVPLNTMTEQLKTLLTNSTGNKNTPRVIARMLQTSHTISGVAFDQILLKEKPPQWWVPGKMSANLSASSDMDSLSASDGSGEEEEQEEDEQEEERAAAKRMEIQQMRTYERAVSSQRFNTEHTREIFYCVTNASDDSELFAMLMHRDPAYHRFPDVCKVLVQCCVQEKQYNPVYGNVLERFCSARRSCRTVLQFTLWDYFKTVRMLLKPDLRGFINVASLICALIEGEVLTLSVLRGLDLEETNKMIGLLVRIILLRLLLVLSPKRLTTVFFGGDGRVALDFKTDTNALRQALEKVFALYFDMPAALSSSSSDHRNAQDSTRWLREMFDVVAVGTPFDIYAIDRDGTGETALPVEETLEIFQKRVSVARKALQKGLL